MEIKDLATKSLKFERLRLINWDVIHGLAATHKNDVSFQMVGLVDNVMLVFKKLGLIQQWIFIN